MGRIYNIRSSWPSYVQERDDTPIIYRTGVIASWQQDYEARQKQADRKKALDLLDSMLSMYRVNNT
jgi:hypothetical protein